MTTYLHIATGPYRFLVDIARVVEVGDIREGADASGRRPWRDRTLPVVDLGRLIGHDAAQPRQHVILCNAQTRETTLALDVEQVMDLLDVDENRLQPLTGISREVDELIDGACIADDGRCLLRLREVPPDAGQAHSPE